MKPVAWMTTYAQDSVIFMDHAPLCQDAIPVFTADQLRQAQVAILREAANKVLGVRESLQLRRMADELEKSK